MFKAIKNVFTRKADMKKLRESELRYRTLFEGTSEGIIVADSKTTKYVFMNPAICDMMGYTKKEMLNNSLLDSHPKDQIEIVKSHFDKQASGEIKTARDIPFLRKDGSVFYADVNSSFLKIDGRHCAIGFVRDISDEKKAKEALNAVLRDLEEANQDLQRFVYIASHDLQAPLRRISFYSERVQSKMNGSDEKSKDHIQRVMNSSSRMLQLIDDLLKYSRIRHVGEEEELACMRWMVSDALADLEVDIREAEAEIHISTHCVEKCKPNIKVSKSYLRTVIQNLVSNALRYKRKGVKPVIEIDCVKKDGFVQVSIKDNGIGFDNKYKDRIFEPFQRLQSKDEYKGTGIGLAICKKIIDHYNGEILVESKEGEGSTFTVRLPQYEPDGQGEN